MVEFSRRDRLVEVIRTELAAILRRVKDPRLSGFLTITGVDLSGDLKSAVVYYSILGTEHEKLNSAKALESAAPYIRHELKGRLRIRIIPTVRFEYDDTPARAGRVHELLTKIEQEREASPELPEPQAPPIANPEREREKGDTPRIRADRTSSRKSRKTK